MDELRPKISFYRGVVQLRKTKQEAQRLYLRTESYSERLLIWPIMGEGRQYSTRGKCQISHASGCQHRSVILTPNCDRFGAPLIVKDLLLWVMERIQQEAEAGSMRRSKKWTNRNQYSRVWALRRVMDMCGPRCHLHHTAPGMSVKLQIPRLDWLQSFGLDHRN